MGARRASGWEERAAPASGRVASTLHPLTPGCASAASVTMSPSPSKETVFLGSGSPRRGLWDPPQRKSGTRDGPLKWGKCWAEPLSAGSAQTQGAGGRSALEGHGGDSPMAGHEEVPQEDPRDPPCHGRLPPGAGFPPAFPPHAFQRPSQDSQPIFGINVIFPRESSTCHSKRDV